MKLTFECPECAEKTIIEKDILDMRRSIGCPACKRFFVVAALRAHGFITHDENVVSGDVH